MVEAKALSDRSMAIRLAKRASSGRPRRPGVALAMVLVLPSTKPADYTNHSTRQENGKDAEFTHQTQALPPALVLDLSLGAADAFWPRPSRRGWARQWRCQTTDKRQSPHLSPVVVKVYLCLGCSVRSSELRTLQ